MIRKTKRIRRALAYIARNCYRSHVLDWDIDEDVADKDAEDAIEWIFNAAENNPHPKRKGLDVRLRELGAPLLPHIDEQG